MADTEIEPETLVEIEAWREIEAWGEYIGGAPVMNTVFPEAVNSPVLEGNYADREPVECPNPFKAYGDGLANDSSYNNRPSICPEP